MMRRDPLGVRAGSVSHDGERPFGSEDPEVMIGEIPIWE